MNNLRTIERRQATEEELASFEKYLDTIWMRVDRMVSYDYVGADFSPEEVEIRFDNRGVFSARVRPAVVGSVAEDYDGWCINVFETVRSRDLPPHPEEKTVERVRSEASAARQVLTLPVREAAKFGEQAQSEANAQEAWDSYVQNLQDTNE